MSLTSSPYILGVYRRHATVVVGEHSATVERSEHDTVPRHERYRVWHEGTMRAVCWQYVVPENSLSKSVPQYDGGWTRAIAIAEQLATEAHERAQRTEGACP